MSIGITERGRELLYYESAETNIMTIRMNEKDIFSGGCSRCRIYVTVNKSYAFKAASEYEVEICEVRSMGNFSIDRPAELNTLYRPDLNYVYPTISIGNALCCSVTFVDL